MIQKIDEDARWRGMFTEVRGLEICAGHELALEPTLAGKERRPTPSALQLVTGSVFVMAKGSRLVIRRGATLVIRTGTRMRMEPGAQVIVEEGGHVYIEHKADIAFTPGESGFHLARGASIGVDPALGRALPELRVPQPIPRV
ncbi:MAG: hypothetical protein H6711_33090 [Myxococcales bacterium]|nr:hypothetical protein [Myxococcales bacterium]